MPPHHPRIHITLDDDARRQLAILSEKQNRSVSAIAADLIREALDLNEDVYLSKIADKRYKEATDSDKWISHQDAWGD